MFIILIFFSRYQAYFGFGCKDEAFKLVGRSSKRTNIVTCLDTGVWDFGDLRCEGPVCEDPGRPADGKQISESYEQGSKVLYVIIKTLFLLFDSKYLFWTQFWVW
jgi:hypothetical protein